MTQEKPIKLKLCLLGPGNVGKTCLIKKYVYDQFDDKYISTLGTKVTKKEITIQHPNNGRELKVNLMIWDIMGQQGFRQLLQQSYFFGAHGIIGVCDVTKPATLEELHDWMRAAFGVTNKVPTVILGNKCDLKEQQEVDINEVVNFASVYEDSIGYLSSAKTGQNIELAFKKLTKNIVEIVID